MIPIKRVDRRIRDKNYEDRWLLELLFAQYKGEECLDFTGVQSDFSLLGVEFVNFIATLITSRMVKKAGNARLLDKMSYGDLMEDLASAWRYSDATGEPRSYDRKWVHTLPSVFDMLERLELSEAVETIPKKRGRPRGEVIRPEKTKETAGKAKEKFRYPS